MFQDKSNLTKKQSLFLAKKYLVSNIYSGARIEGVNITFPETEAIVNGINIGHLSIDDIQTVCNLKRAWEYVLSCTADFSYDFVLKINEEVSRGESLSWGTLRNGKVGIGGTDYVPPVPLENEVRTKLNEILALPSATERALEYYAYAVKAQLFWDGNKRTSWILANKLLIDGGAGILYIKDNEKEFVEFNRQLQNYYNTDNKIAIKNYLYESCIVTMEIL